MKNMTFKKITSQRLFLPIFCLALVLLVNIVTTPNFFAIEVRNGVLYGYLIDIINRASELVILAVGMTLVVSSSAGTDISVGAIVCLSATLSCMVCNTNAPFIVVVLTALVVGALCGAVNGFILTRFKELPPMIVTLATQIIFRGIAEVTLGAGGSIAITNTDGFRAIGGKVGNIPYILFLVLILGVIFAIFLGKSTFGRRTYAIGTNRVAAYYAGVHVEKIRFIIYTIMGLMSGLCAVFLVSSSYGANTTTGNGFEMDAIAMAVFGGISSTGGKGNLAGGIISAFIIVCLRVGLGQKNVNAQVILLIIGVLLVAAVALPNIIGDVKKAVAMKKN